MKFTKLLVALAGTLLLLAVLVLPQVIEAKRARAALAAAALPQGNSNVVVGHSIQEPRQFCAQAAQDATLGDVDRVDTDAECGGYFRCRPTIDDVSPVGLPVPDPGRNTDMQAVRVRRDRLQQVEDVQVQDRFGPFVGAVQFDVEPVPQAVPGTLVPGEQYGEVPRSNGGQPGILTALGDRAVPGGVEGDDLLHADLPQEPRHAPPRPQHVIGRFRQPRHHPDHRGRGRRRRR